MYLSFCHSALLHVLLHLSRVKGRRQDDLPSITIVYVKAILILSTRATATVSLESSDKRFKNYNCL